MRSTWTIAWVVATAGAFGAGQDFRGEIARCAVIEDKGARLSCYDEVAKVIEGAAATSATGGAGEWTMQISENADDGSENVLLFLAADEGESVFGDPVTLVLRCQGPKRKPISTRAPRW